MTADRIHESPLAQVWLGRAEDVLPLLMKGSADCVATDPPYGQGWQSNRRKASDPFALIEGDDGTHDVAEVIRAACRVLRNNRHLYIFGPDITEGLPLTDPAQLIWDKGNPSQGAMDRAWGSSHEPITFTTYVPSAANRARGDSRLATRLRRGSVLRVPRLNSRAVKRHPTEKPVSLMRQLIESSTVLGETVLDPYAGVGSTLVAAVLSGRRAIGIELDEGYAEIAVERVKRAEKLALEMEGL